MFFDRAMSVFSVFLVHQTKSSCLAGWPWVMYGAVFSSKNLINRVSIDPLSLWSYTYNRPTEDGSLLRSTSEIEGHSCVRVRNCTHTSTVASCGLPSRIVRDICTLWRLFVNNRWIRGRNPYCGPVHTAGVK